jgi:hypothetical protein
VTAQHTALVYANVSAIRAWAEASMPASAKARYVADVKPYLAAFDTFIATSSIAGDLDRATGALSLK